MLIGIHEHIVHAICACYQQNKASGSIMQAPSSGLKEGDDVDLLFSM
jgi:hypothetical protein